MLHLQEQANLITLYSTPNRHYHNWTHVQYMLRKATAYYGKDFIPRHVELAIYYHDAIYDPYSKFNEENSVELFCGVHSKLYTETRNTTDCILATRFHFQNLPKYYDVDFIKVFLDLDLAVLGEDSWYYNNVYAKNVEKEYYYTDKATFAQSRIKFLEGALKQNSIYRTDYFAEKYEKNARANMESEIEFLSIVK